MLLTGPVRAATLDTLLYIDSAQGLPQRSVRSVLVDHDNLIWVGTEKGLARFDGHRFVDLSATEEGIPRDVAMELFEDSQGRIWSNWYRNNPRVLLPDRRTILEIQPPGQAPDDLHESLTGIHETPDGSVWFHGQDYLYRLTTAGRVDYYPLDGAFQSNPLGVGNSVFIGTTRGLFVQDWRNPASAPHSVALPGQGAGSDGRTGVFTLHQRGERLVACAEHGIFEIDPNSLAAQLLLGAGPGQQFYRCQAIGPRLLISQFNRPGQPYDIIMLDLPTRRVVEPWPGIPATGLVQSGLMDGDGRYWLVISDQLYLSDASPPAFRQIRLAAPTFGRTAPLARSRDGVVWIGTDGAGLARFAPYANKFATWRPGIAGLPENLTQVRRMAVDESDNVWLGTERSGILYWDRKANTWTHHNPRPGNAFKEILVLPDQSVWATAARSGEVLRFDPIANQWVTEFDGLDWTIPLIADHDGRRLVTVSHERLILHRYDPASRQMSDLNFALPQDGGFGPVRALILDQADGYWLGTHGAGLVHVDGNGRTRYWSTRNSTITSDQIFALHLDPGGQLWIGTWHGGLLSYDPASEQFRHFGLEDGLPSSTVFGILQDEEGALWLSTYDGLAQFRPCSPDSQCQPEIRLFDEHDGLPGKEFDAESFYRSASGEMFFGGFEGFTTFRPEQIRLNTRQPRTAITQLLLNGMAVVADPRDTLELELPWNYGDVVIELSSLDYSAPAKNRFWYRESGAGEWIPLAGASLALRNLVDGMHTLEFRGSNNDGLWSGQSARLDLRVKPPLYRHPGLLVLYTAVLLLLPSLYYRHRQAQLRAQRRALELKVQERTRQLELASSARERFFANISHEISAPLHMILLMLENNLESEMTDRETLYRSATGYAAQLKVYLRQLVDDSRQRELDQRLYAAEPGMIIRHLVEVNLPVALARGIGIHFGTLDAGSVPLRISSATSIFSNLLCNALVYTPEGGEIHIAGKVEDGRYRMTIKNSSSLTPDVIDLENLLERGQRGRFDPTTVGGHGLGLSIVTDALASLGGSLERTLRKDGWLEFTVDLPLCAEPLPPLPRPTDLIFSHEQQLAIELVNSQLSSGPDRVTGRGKARVLIIEDDEKVARLLAMSLGRDFAVSIAGTCAEGLRKALAEVPGVVICDLFLPDASGFEAVRAIRDNRMTMDTLIIMATASISEQDRKQGIRLGVDHFVSKPVSAETLRLMINTHIELSRQRHEKRRADELRRQARRPAEIAPRSFAENWAAALQELFAQSETTIEDFQTRLSLSYSALVKGCKETFGNTPRRLLIEKRVEEAKKLLETSDTRVGLISELTGFSSQSQFSVTFKRETGMTPAAWRNQARRTEGER